MTPQVSRASDLPRHMKKDPMEAEIPDSMITRAFLIREAEQRFLALFSEGKLAGTVHTCVGQEFSALAFAGQLEEGDSVFSNHRCHGHFLAFTGDLDGLVAELMGKKSGVCGGLGSSQHLYKSGFYSNGIQGGITPLAVGMAWARKQEGNGRIVVVYIGDGTLGEGIVYESMNLAAKFSVPLLFVCEDNGLAQSTRTADTIAGLIPLRAEAFGIQTWSGTTDEPAGLLENGRLALGWVREHQKPGFFHVRTARLNPHSKGDDNRDETEMEHLRQRDYLCQLVGESPEFTSSILDRVSEAVECAVNLAEQDQSLPLDDCLAPAESQLPTADEAKIHPPAGERMVNLLNAFFLDTMELDEKVVFIGEDIRDPYGGAFKATRGLSSRFPERVLGTPISEAGLTGMANGLALAGWRPWAEIMFGDFVTLAFDQIINHASKFFHMYNRQVNCPLVLRTAVGGGRGYGPTHSQSLEKFLCGIDNVRVVALNSWLEPQVMLGALRQSRHPALVIEHKLDYGRRVGIPALRGYSAEVSTGDHPAVTLRPDSGEAIASIVTYGGMAPIVAEVLPRFIEETGYFPEIVVLGQLHPLDLHPLFRSIARTSRLVVIEEGGTAFGIGAEILASAIESGIPLAWARRIGAAPIPIPSPPILESCCLPSRNSILESLLRIFQVCLSK